MHHDRALMLECLMAGTSGYVPQPDCPVAAHYHGFGCLETCEVGHIFSGAYGNHSRLKATCRHTQCNKICKVPGN
eukprot:360719-Chlamydomonas_euryale.AAC.16